MCGELFKLQEKSQIIKKERENETEREKHSGINSIYH